MTTSKKNTTLIKRKFILIFAILIVFWGIVYSVNFLSLSTSLGGLFDFGSFIASGQLANKGENPYSIESTLINHVSFPEIGIEGAAPNLNPPISVMFFQVLAKYDPYYSIMVWRIITIILFIIAIILLHRIYPAHGFNAIIRFLWVFSLAGIWHTIRLGQIYGFTMLLVVITWMMLKNGRSVIAGIILGILIAIKPNFVFWAILLLFASDWRTFLSSGITSMCISIIPIFTHGLDIYKQWIEATTLFTPNLLPFPGNNSFQGLTSRFGSSTTGIILSILLCISLIIIVLKNKPAKPTVNGLGIISSLLISPIAWTGYTLMALPVFFEKQSWNWSIRISAIIFSIPFVFILMLFTKSFLNFVLFGWFYGWGLLCLIAWLCFESWKISQKPQITS